MASLPRSTRKMILLALFVLALLAQITVAQSDTALRAVGSGASLPVIEALTDDVDDISLTTEVTGTGPGISLFCSGEADFVAASRAITTDEDLACQEAGIAYNEYLIAHAILTIIAHSETAPTCLTGTQLGTLLAPSATGIVTDWSGITDDEAEAEPIPLSVYLPPTNTLPTVLLDEFVAGAGFRTDAIIAEPAEIVSTVADTAGALGIVPLADVGEAANVNLLEYDSGTGCTAPTLNNVEDRLYAMFQPLFLYTRADLYDQAPALIDSLINADADTLRAAGFSPVTPDTVELNQQIAQGEAEGGRQFSIGTTTFQIPETLAGEITVAGSGSPYTLVDRVLTPLTATQPELTITYNIEGVDAGIRRLCNGEVNLTLSERALTEEEESACEANNVTPVTVPIGSQAVVLVGNAQDDFNQCLATEQLLSIFGVTETPPTNWNEVSEDFPDQPMTLFTPAVSNTINDLLLQTPEGPVLPLRADTEVNADPLYRAAATANVPGALTYMTWPEYQNVLNNEQTNIQLISVDAGSGCAQPDAEAILSGDYPLSREFSVIANQSALVDINVQSVLWSLFTEDNLSALQSSGLTDVTGNSLGERRDQLQSLFDQSLEAVLAAPEEPATDDTGSESASDTTEGDDTSASSDEDDASAEETEAEGQ